MNGKPAPSKGVQELMFPSLPGNRSITPSPPTVSSKNPASEPPSCPDKPTPEAPGRGGNQDRQPPQKENRRLPPRLTPLDAYPATALFPRYLHAFPKDTKRKGIL
jgi:hypothetical protein